MLLDPHSQPDHGTGADPSPFSESSTIVLPDAGPPTLAERVRLGFQAGIADNVAIVPFTEGWDLKNLYTDLESLTKVMVARKMDEGWRLTLHRYRAEDGQIVLIILRLDHPTGAEAKIIRPLRVSRMAGIRADVVVGSLAIPRPLYALDQIAKRPEAPILFVEGEKAADAGAAHFPDHVVTTWPGGADGVASTDLRAVAGRDTVIWPDNDAAGAGSARKLGRALLAAGAASVRVVPVPKSFPPKWDIADPVPEMTHD